MDDHAPRAAPWKKAAADWIVPDPLDLSFEGFSAEAFAILDRLRSEPHITQYRKEKPGIKRYITDPFKRFRDDLVVNWVLPNRLDFETEKNVFSRLLKNDFGAGGCHHHLWMSFYRPSRRRLTDVQLAPCITPDAFTMGLFVGAYMKDLLRHAKANIAAAPEEFLALVNPLLQSKKTLACSYGAGQQRVKTVFNEPMAAVPDDLHRAEDVWIRDYICRDEVLALRGGLVGWTIAVLRDVWPVYRFLLEGSPS